MEKRDGGGGCAKEGPGHLQGPSLDIILYHAKWASLSAIRREAGMNKAKGPVAKVMMAEAKNA